MITRTFKLCLNAGTGSAPFINVSQTDRDETWLFELYTETGERYIPSSGAIIGIKADGHGIANTGTVDSEGRVVITETEQMTAAAGRSIFELSIDGLTHGTANFIVNVEKKPIDGAIMSDSDLSLISQAVDAVSEIEDLLGGQDVPTVITPIISDWLDDNITNPSNPPIDTSLTVAGAAADAKTTGDEITDLKNTVVTKTEMANCQTISIPASANRCDMDAIIPNTAINWYTGVTSIDANKCLYSIDVNQGDVLYIWALNSSATIISAQGFGFTTYDINGNHTRQGTGTYYHEYTVPENVYRLTIQFNQNWVNTGYKYIILINDSTQPTSYEPYADAHDEYVAKNEFLANASIIGEKKILIDVFPQSRLFNYNGIFEKNANFLTTDYIQVYENDVINAAGYSYVETNPNAVVRTNVVSFFGEDFSYISGIYSTEASGLVTVENASVPSGAKYVVFGKHTTLQASKSYAYITRQYANIKKTVGEDVRISVLPVLPVKKIISVLGDSISQGEVATDRPNNSYVGILRQLFGLEYGNHMNYGFVSMSRAKDMVYLTNWSGWTETTGSTTAIGGDEYATTTAGSKLTFRIGKRFSKVKIATKFGSGYGTLTLAQGESVFGVIDCSTGDGAGFSEAIDISSADFTQAFTITASDSASVSGLVLIDDDDYWTFMNYGRSGAAASVFTGDTFDIQTNADIIIYALGVNGTNTQLLNSLNDIKTRFSGLDAHRIVLDLNFTTAQRNGESKHSLLKQFANETGAKYICVWDYVPKDEMTGYVANGFLNTDGIHPIDAGHQFIAELVAKEIELSVNSKEFAQDVLNTKITWSVE